MPPVARDRLLRVNLTERTVTSEPVPQRWRRKYLGGKGLGARYLYDELDPGTDPLGPDNVLLFVLGPASGYLPGEQRYAAITKSPLTGAFLDSYAGGDFPLTLAGALENHIAILVTGRASEPIRLEVEAGTARIEPTSTWGADTVETDRSFPEASVACIGPAGERQVAYATIASDEARHHAGRGGAGAVMGAKRLKAVVVRGDPPRPDGSIAALRERDLDRYADSHTGRWQAASETLETVEFADTADVLASHGWRERGFEGAEDVGVDAAREAAVGRERDGDIPGGFRIETPEGETVPRGATGMSLGAGLGISDFDAVAALGEQCNRLGVDLISAGNAVAWAIRASEAEIVDRDLAFGEPEEAGTLLEEIAHRSSALGAVLADGVEDAADQYGGRDLVPVVKRMSLPSYDPSGVASMALAYATSDRGACHRRARPVERAVFEESWGPERAAAAIAAAQDIRSVRWSLVADDFTGESLDVANWLDAVGAPTEDLENAGERIWNLVRLFNVREGFDRNDDALPTGFTSNQGFDADRFDRMLDAYYDRRGWDRSGKPSQETLARLDLHDIQDGVTPPTFEADTEE
ncbi:MAG: aldehyde ferredoxin oxidoreductase family protein [Natronomonas sp.]